MSDFKVKVGKTAGAKQGAKPPAERKPVHPGLQQIGTDIRCLKCGDFLDCSSFGRHGVFSVAICRCGLWFNDRDFKVRWLRWSSEPFFTDGNPIFAPKR